MCIKRYVSGISLTYKAELKRMLVGYPIKISIKGKRRRPVRLSNKGGKYLITSSLSVKPPRWRNCGLRRVGPHPYGSYNLYTMRLRYYRSLVLI